MTISFDLRSAVSAARLAARKLALAGRAEKDRALLAAADLFEARASDLSAANAKDVGAATAAGLSAAMVDRLRLDEKRIHQMAAGLREVAALPDPVGGTIGAWRRPNGLNIAKVRIPIGVVAIVYESRPNVTADAAALCLKSGNACVLRGGSESICSNVAIADLIEEALRGSGLPDAAVTLVRDTDRALVRQLLRMDDIIDLVIPRGGNDLIRTVVESSTIPVIKHDKGVCHVYVHAAADLEMALAICVNAKCQRPGTCNAAETFLIDSAVAASFLPRLHAALAARGVEVRGCERTLSLLGCRAGLVAAAPEDWDTEYLDLIVSIRVVEDIGDAMEHIATHGSGHSDAIVTRDYEAAELFLRSVDSAAVYVNASTRFTDGYEFGLGAEIGISTNRIHARGPMGLEDLTTTKYVVRGSGQLRG